MISLRVVIVGYGNPQALVRTLNSLDEHLSLSAEVLVRDNGECAEPVERWALKKGGHLKVKVIGDGKNVGFSAAVNEAAAYATSTVPTHLLLLNPDAELLSDFTPEIAQKLADLGGIVGLRVWNDREMKSRQASARSFPSLKTSVSGREGLLTRLWPSNPWSREYLAADLDPERPSKVDWVSGCALWVSTADWKRLGGFDEKYFLYVEDVDLGQTAKQLGIPVHFAPWVDVLHAIRGSASSVPARSDLYHHRGMWTYHRKWASPGSWWLTPFVFLGICLRFGLRRLLHLLG